MPAIGDGASELSCHRQNQHTRPAPSTALPPSHGAGFVARNGGRVHGANGESLRLWKQNPQDECLIELVMADGVMNKVTGTETEGKPTCPTPRKKTSLTLPSLQSVKVVFGRGA